jgi:hypothetical protein
MRCSDLPTQPISTGSGAECSRTRQPTSLSAAMHIVLRAPADAGSHAALSGPPGSEVEDAAQIAAASLVARFEALRGEM